MTDEEVDFAIKYAEERRLRLKIENRMHAFMYATLYMTGTAMDLVSSVTNRDAKQASDNIHALIQRQADACILLNMGAFNALSDPIPGTETLQRVDKNLNICDMTDEQYRTMGTHLEAIETRLLKERAAKLGVSLTNIRVTTAQKTLERIQEEAKASRRKTNPEGHEH